jgi:hypothetical protein
VCSRPPEPDHVLCAAERRRRRHRALCSPEFLRFPRAAPGLCRARKDVGRVSDGLLRQQFLTGVPTLSKIWAPMSPLAYCRVGQSRGRCRRRNLPEYPTILLLLLAGQPTRLSPPSETTTTATRRGGAAPAAKGGAHAARRPTTRAPTRRGGGAALAVAWRWPVTGAPTGRGSEVVEVADHRDRPREGVARKRPGWHQGASPTARGLAGGGGWRGSPAIVVLGCFGGDREELTC